MTVFHSIILGIIEGLTEFLPVSSTAHLIITSKIMGLSQSDFQKFFEVFIQSGAILAVIFLYVRYVLQHKQVIKTILFSFIPTAIIGLFLYKIIKDVFFESNTLIIISMFVVGVVFLIVEYFIKQKQLVLKKTINEMGVGQAIIIGLAQALAVIPGVSRAGIVIAAMMCAGYKREESAKYSFLLAVPTILAATGLDLVKTVQTISLDVNEIILLTIGFVVSFVSAYLVVKWFVSFLQKKTLIVFGVYRIILAIILAIVIFKPL